MDIKQVLLICLMTIAVVKAGQITKAEEAEVDAIVASLQAGRPINSWNPNPVVPVNPPSPVVAASSVSTNVLPYEAARQNFYGSVGIHKPAGTFSISTAGLLQAQSEILRLVEAFLRLKGQLAGHLLAVFNNNYELIRGLGNFLVAKVPHLHGFALKGISVLRKILEFAVHTFSEWTIALPSINFEASHEAYVQPPQPQPQPHETYGLPSVNVGSFLENFSKRR